MGMWYDDFPKANTIMLNAFRDCYAYNHAELPTKVTSSTLHSYVGSLESDEPDGW